MLKLTKPPVIDLSSVWVEIVDKHIDNISHYLAFSTITDDKGRYLPYDEFQYRVPKGLNKELAWGLTKSERERNKIKLFSMGDELSTSSFVLTANIQKTISITDRNTTTAVLEWMSNNIGEEHYLKYLLNDLIEDESISSSQMEGAVTTTLAAKNMLKKKKKPRTPDEKMILGNFNMMKFVWEKRHETLSVDLIKELHRIGVEGIDDDRYCPGIFRELSDNIVIADVDGDVVYVPPKADGIDKRLNILSQWANKCHDDANGQEYIHPLIKAIILHFSIGYEHPFKDGNGRVARAIFYWFMFKNNYSAFRYIAISKLLKSASKKYGMSYVYSETDNLDLTYFIEYQCEIISRSINEFKHSYNKACEIKNDFEVWMWQSGLLRKLNDKQLTIFNVARSKIENTFTATSVSLNLGCSYNTAANALNGLVALKIFKKEKINREWNYRVLSTKAIKDNLNNEQ